MDFLPQGHFTPWTLHVNPWKNISPHRRFAPWAFHPMDVSPHRRCAPKTIHPTDNVNINNQQRPGLWCMYASACRGFVHLFIQPGPQGHSQDVLLPRWRKLRPEAAKWFSRILSVHSGLSSRSVWVKHFSYLTHTCTRPMLKIATWPHSTEAASSITVMDATPCI